MNLDDAFEAVEKAPILGHREYIWSKESKFDGLCVAKGLRAFLVTSQNGGVEQNAGEQEGRDRVGFWCDHVRALRNLNFDISFGGRVSRLTDYATKYVDGLGWKGHTYSLGGIDVRRLDFVSISEPVCYIVMRLANNMLDAINVRISAAGEIGPRYMWPGSVLQVRGAEGPGENAFHIFDCSDYFVGLYFGSQKIFERDGGKFRVISSSLIPPTKWDEITFIALADFDEKDLIRRIALSPSSCGAEFERSTQYYESNVLAMPSVQTTDPSLNKAIDSAKGVLLELYSDSPVGKGWFAGIPCFSWFFTGDGAMISRAANSIGLWMMTEGHLRTMASFRSEKGQIPHELILIPDVNSRALRTGYMHISATPLWITSLYNTYMWAGELSLISRLYPDVRAALGFLSSLDRDGDGLIEAFPEELLIAWDEVTSEARKGPCVEINALYLHAITCASRMAHDLGLQEEAEQLATKAKELKAIFTSSFWNAQEGIYYDRIDPVPKIEVAPYLAWPLIMGLSDRGQGIKVIDRIQKDGLIGPCGVSIWRYEGGSQEGYYRGSVWPFYSGMVALASFKYGRMEIGASLLKVLLDLTYSSSDPGKINEYYSHDCKERGQFMQGFSSSPVIGLITEGLMGLEPDAPGSQIALQPWLPDWLRGVRIAGLRIGESKLNLSYEVLERERLIAVEHVSGGRALEVPISVPVDDVTAARNIPDGWEVLSTLRGQCIAKRLLLSPGSKAVERLMLR
jgi:hypothetical protein